MWLIMYDTVITVPIVLPISTIIICATVVYHSNIIAGRKNQKWTTQFERGYWCHDKG